MRSHYNKKKRNKKITLIALIVFLLLVIFTPLYSYIYDVLEKPFSSASINTAHIQQKSANIFHTWFTKKKLVEENNRLKAENKLLQVDVLRTRYLEKTLETMSVDLTKADEFSFVVKKNNNGLITIKGGANKDRKVGEKILAHDGSFVGTIEHVFDLTSHVALFTKNNKESFGILFPQDISVTLLGNGNAMVAELQRDIEVSVGDVVYSQNTPGYIIGQVSHVDFDPRDPAKTVYITRIQALDSLQTMGIIKNN